MSDERLRELERRWKETGVVEDEAPFLLERVRVGELCQEKLELAAYLGNEAAVLATRLSRRPVHENDLQGWLHRLRPFGKETLVRAAVAVAWRTVERWEQEFPGDVRVRGAVRAAEDWICCPCKRHVEEARRACEFDRDLGPMWVSGMASSAVAAARAAAFSEGQPRVLAVEEYRETSERVSERLRELGAEITIKADATNNACSVLCESIPDKAVFSAIQVLAEELGLSEHEARIRLRRPTYGYAVVSGLPGDREAVCAELVPWALGLSDPVRERVGAARRQEAGGE